jgi:UDP-glucose 4-epimerase
MEEENKHILITGGTGYIGVHTLVSLLESGYHVTVIDNLCNSSEHSLERALAITGADKSRVRFFKVDMRYAAELEAVFQQSPRFSACIHFAGLKAVGESVRKPLLYYANNLDSTIILLDLMSKYNCNSIIFSSSATVRYILCSNGPFSKRFFTGVWNSSTSYS